ncbi:MAG TPA: hypothetical protein VJX30_15995 [Terriglobales bacterium]|nr:hypothetical protein [Terriglobales bacterium]
MFATIAAALGTVAAQAAHPDQQPPAPFAIEISAPGKTLLGAPLPLQIKLTNISNKNIIVGQDMAKEPAFFYSINVYDAQGGEPASTNRHCHGNLLEVELAPGKSIQDNTDFNDWFEFKRPGKYTIQAVRNNGKTPVWSNRITVDFIP